LHTSITSDAAKKQGKLEYQVALPLKGVVLRGMFAKAAQRALFAIPVTPKYATCSF
jgi:hypothetical protein